MKRMSIQSSLFILFLNLIAISAFSQEQSKADIAQRYIKENAAKWNLNPTDVTGFIISDEYFSGHNGVTHVFFNQRYNNIAIYNAIAGVHITTEGKVGYATNDFKSAITEAVNTTTATISAYQAIEYAAKNVGAYANETLRLISEISTQEYLYAGGSTSNSDIKVKLVLQPIANTDEIRLAWHLTIDQVDGADMWSVRVDATNGEILERNNLTLYCSFSDENHNHQQTCLDDFTPAASTVTQQSSSFVLGETYNVLPFPAESPIHGDRMLLTDPNDVVASPFGWHDTNGVDGAEYEITRGNNVHAYLDLEDADVSSGGEPEGGASLLFDFPFDESLEPTGYQDAAITQLFYAVNAIHDFTFNYGFDEAAGNFQARNYSDEGFGGDDVRAEGQDGSGTNNANFATPSDGSKPRMQMFVWDRVGGQLLSVLEPAGIAGGYETGTASYGPAISSDAITGTIIDAYDATNDASLGCETIVNAEEVSGNIAMVDRGSCYFQEKTLKAEEAGAIALIICNFEENAMGMGPAPAAAELPQPTIPTVSLKKSTCTLFRQLLSDGVMVQIVLPDDSGPINLDACFDNGVIAHEFGHGISNRLSGGAASSGCLGNDEQMGEGWSDFFTLAQTVRPGDVGETKKGIGNYLIRAGVTGGGIRNLPYTTDFNINNHTYDDIIGTTSPHALGEVWATMLWDMYWAFVDEYGFDEDQVTGSGGNNMAIQLVMDGLKLQGCSPGFVSGRDGILGADILLNGGANQCLIWEVFARRGLGYFADQGSTNSRFDGVENFDSMPECIKELKITKAVTPLITAGDQIEVTLTITNHKEEGVTNVIVSDELSAGSAYVAGTSSGVEPDVGDGSMVSFEVGSLAAGASMELTYEISTDAGAPSISSFYDDMENGGNNWEFGIFEGFSIWFISNIDAHSGANSWFVEDTELENDQLLNLASPFTVTGNQPVLRFYHKYDTQLGIDGGFVQISTDGGSQWEYVDELIFKNGYRGRVAYGTFAIPNLNAFWGVSGGFIDTYIDLNPYIGEDILVRFRFGSDANPDEAPEDGLGWFVDDFEILDMVNYNGEACVNSDEGDEACAFAESKGSIVEVDRITSVDNPIFDAGVQLYPNPTSETLNISFAPKRSTEVTFEVISTEGRTLFTNKQDFGAGRQTVTLNIANVPTGFYFVKISSDNEVFTKKLIVE